MKRYLLTGTSWVLGSAALAAVSWDLAASQVPVDATGEPLVSPAAVTQLNPNESAATVGDIAANPVIAAETDSTITSGDEQLQADSITLFTATELDEIVGPVALYPDDLLAIVLPAASYPLQIVQAARFLDDLESDPTLQPDEAWDDSVVALLNYPEVVRLLNEDLDWTWKLGQAFMDQQANTIAAIERFRDRAYAAGNLKTDEHQVVSNDNGTIEIEHVDDDIIYVPYYEPEEVVVYQVEPVYYYYPRAYPVYYYPYPVGYSFFSPFFWGVTTVYHMGWYTDHLHVYHHSYYGHPYYGRRYHDHYYYRRPDINIHINYYGDNDNHRYRHRERDGDLWRPRTRHGSGPRGRRDRDHDRRRDGRLDVLTTDSEVPRFRHRPETGSLPAFNRDLRDGDVLRHERRARQQVEDGSAIRSRAPDRAERSLGNRNARSEGGARPDSSRLERRDNQDANRLRLEERRQRRADAPQAIAEDRRTQRQSRQQPTAPAGIGNHRDVEGALVGRNTQRDAIRNRSRIDQGANRSVRPMTPANERLTGRENPRKSVEPLPLKPRPESSNNVQQRRTMERTRNRSDNSVSHSQRSAENNRATIETRRSEPRRLESTTTVTRKPSTAVANRPAQPRYRAEQQAAKRSAVREQLPAPRRDMQQRSAKPAPQPEASSARSRKESSSNSDRRRRDRNRD